MSYAKLVLSGPYRDTTPSDRSLRTRVADRRAFHFSSFVTTVESLLQRRSVRHVIVEMHADFLPEFTAAAEQVRRELQRLQSSGKELHFCATQYRETALYLASSCAYRHIAPLGTVTLDGIGHTFVFLRRLLERKGVRAEVFRRGKYKSAADPFRTDTLDPDTQRQYQEYFDVKQREVVRVLREDYKRTPEAIEELRNGRVIHDHEAVTERWVHDVATVEDIAELLKKRKQKQARLKTKAGGHRKGKQVAVLFVEGPIVDGESRRHALFGNAVGAATVVQQIASISKNKRCKAAVLRVNSPGGSAAASELIRYELHKLAQKKPLVVSMSTVAASGGYWISMAGTPVLAERTTLTGSIGVVSLVLTGSRLMHRLGITHRSVKTTPYQDMGSIFRSMTNEERVLMEREIERIYTRFLQLVAAARQIDVVHAHQLAQGRIWDGLEALNQKLVDEIGGLPQAIDRAAAIAGLKKPAVRYYPRFKPSILDRLVEGRTVGPAAAAIPTASDPTAAGAEALARSTPLADLTPHLQPAEMRALSRTPLLILPEALDSLHSTLQSMVASM